jgi:TolB-like protein
MPRPFLRIWLLFSFFCFSAVCVDAFQRELPAAASSLADEIASTKIRSLAVVDFTDLQGNVTELGRFVAEEMALGLVTAKKQLSVIDRTQLRVLLQEHKLASLGIIDPATARRVGEIAGVDALVTGSITPLGDSVRLVIKVLDSSTARILAASSVEIAKTKTIEELMSRDVRGEPNTAAAGAATPQREVQSNPGNAPVFQSASIRATVGQIGVSSDNRRVGLSVTVENISRNPLYLAFTSQFGYGSDPNVSLSDDRATSWRIQGVSGISVLRFGSEPKQSDFTVIAPAERLTVVMNFTRNTGDDTPGTTFSFGAQGTYFTQAGLQNVSIGLAGIRAITPKK